MKMYNGQEVKTVENFSYEEAKIGDLVDADFIGDMLDCLPPACMRSDCSQMGEPYSHREDPKTGRWRPTFATFKRIAGCDEDGIWEYCGHCFCGENVERGNDPIYVKG